MPRKIFCDNESNGCSRVKLVNRFYDAINTDEANWVTVERDEVVDYESDEDKVIHSQLYLEFCSVNCAAEKLSSLT